LAHEIRRRIGVGRLTDKTFLEKYPEFKKFYELIVRGTPSPNTELTLIKEILDEHFVRKEEYDNNDLAWKGTLQIFKDHSIDKQKVKDAIDKLKPKEISGYFQQESVDDKRKSYGYYLALLDIKTELGLE